MSIFADRQSLLNRVDPDHHPRRSLLAMFAALPFAPMAASRKAGPSDVPTVRASPDRARRLAELAGRFAAMGDEQARLQDETDELNHRYWEWHGEQPCPEPEGCHVCHEPECLRRWREYCARNRLAGDVREGRRELYREIVTEVESALDEAGVRQPATNREQLSRWCRPLATVQAEGRSFALVGSVSFLEDSYSEGWGDTEVIIL